jgi:hypothetical protein
VQEHHRRAIHHEEGTVLHLIVRAPNFPDPIAEAANERLADGPGRLNGFDVSADPA